MAKSFCASDKYEVTKELNRGAFGVVYFARRRVDNSICVLKVVKIRGDEKDERQALSESLILRKLECPFLVGYFDAFIEKGSLYLALEYCEMGDVRTWLKGKTVPEETFWKLFLPICLGLDYLHRNRILHRDFKTENIFLTAQEEVKIGDLGLAKDLMTAAMASTVLGTPRIMSPELMERKRYNAKTDCWALGIVLYEFMHPKHKGPFDDARSFAHLVQLVLAPSEALPPPFKGAEEHPV